MEKMTEQRVEEIHQEIRDLNETIQFHSKNYRILREGLEALDPEIMRLYKSKWKLERSITKVKILKPIKASNSTKSNKKKERLTELEMKKPEDLTISELSELINLYEGFKERSSNSCETGYMDDDEDENENEY